MSLWTLIKPEIGERWPEWEPTSADDRDWERALGGESLEDVKETLFWVRCKYSSRVPQLKWVLDILRAVKAERKPAGSEAKATTYAERLRLRWMKESPIETAILERMSDDEILCDDLRLLFELAKRTDVGGYGPRGVITTMRYWDWQQRRLELGKRKAPVLSAPFDERAIDEMWKELTDDN